MYTIIDFKKDADVAVAHIDDYTTETYTINLDGVIYCYNMIEKWDENGELATLAESYYIDDVKTDRMNWLMIIALVFTNLKTKK